MTAIADAASVVLARDRAAAAPEVFVVRRSDRLRFFGGYHAFPGGRVAPEDADVPMTAWGSRVRQNAGGTDPRVLANAATEPRLFRGSCSS